MQDRILLFQVLVLLLVAHCSARQRLTEIALSHAGGQGAALASIDIGGAHSNYVLGSDDQIALFVSDIEEINGKPIRIDMKGDINLPMAGRVHAAGLTADQLEQEIDHRLKRFLYDPEVIVSITEFRSQPIAVLGAIGSPGVHQLEGHKTLFEVLSLAGGLRQDAGNTVMVTRSLKWGRIPLSNAKDDPTAKFSVASVSVKSVTGAINPTENIAIKPEDVISVPKADLIYVIGAVHKPGGFVLGQNDSLSALQVVSLAEGLERTAAPQRARIMRTVPGNSTRSEIPVDLKKLMAGKAADVSLRADDILFIPNSATKNAGVRAMEAAIQIGTGVAVYSRY
jgi:polysaccharide export outer membrane protein